MHANNCDFFFWVNGTYRSILFSTLISFIVMYILKLDNKLFEYNPAANYQPNGGCYLQILSGKDLYKQTIVVSDGDTFPARFLNIFVDYPLGQMYVGDKLCTNWNKAPLKLWQTQLNFAVW